MQLECLKTACCLCLFLLITALIAQPQRMVRVGIVTSSCRTQYLLRTTSMFASKVPGCLCLPACLPGTPSAPCTRLPRLQVRTRPCLPLVSVEVKIFLSSAPCKSVYVLVMTLSSWTHSPAQHKSACLRRCSHAPGPRHSPHSGGRPDRCQPCQSHATFERLPYPYIWHLAYLDSYNIFQTRMSWRSYCIAV